MDRRTLIASLVTWLPFAITIIGVTAMIYLAVQQNYRSSANDPQIQIALDTRMALENGAPLQNFVPSGSDAPRIDISQSLAPFTIIYDTKGQLVGSTATVGDQTPSVPHGVLTSAHSSGMDVVTWSPGHGVRTALVVVPYANGYIAVGRSIRYVEQREDGLNAQVGLPCAFTLVVSFLGILLTRLLGKRMDLGI